MSYITEATARAKRRKSPWNLLLVPAVLFPLVAIWVSLVYVAAVLHAVLYPGQTLGSAVGPWPILTTVAPFFAAIPLAMIIGNGIVWLVPRARRTLEAEAAGHPGGSFIASQRLLLKASLYVVPAAVGASFLGACLRW